MPSVFGPAYGEARERRVEGAHDSGRRRANQARPNTPRMIRPTVPTTAATLSDGASTIGRSEASDVSVGADADPVTMIVPLHPRVGRADQLVVARLVDLEHGRLVVEDVPGVESPRRRGRGVADPALIRDDDLLARLDCQRHGRVAPFLDIERLDDRVLGGAGEVTCGGAGVRARDVVASLDPGLGYLRRDDAGLARLDPQHLALAEVRLVAEVGHVERAVATELERGREHELGDDRLLRPIRPDPEEGAGVLDVAELLRVELARVLEHVHRSVGGERDVDRGGQALHDALRHLARRRHAIDARGARQVRRVAVLGNVDVPVRPDRHPDGHRPGQELGELAELSCRRSRLDDPVVVAVADVQLVAEPDQVVRVAERDGVRVDGGRRVLVVELADVGDLVSASRPPRRSRASARPSCALRRPRTASRRAS